MVNIHPRRLARKRVLEALFSYQYNKNEPAIIIKQVLSRKPSQKENTDFIGLLFNTVIDNLLWSDKIIKSHLENWEFERVALVDKVLLRMGICEIFFIQDIPPKVSISEMVEIAKIYSTDESPIFINGILDAVYKDYKKRNKD